MSTNSVSNDNGRGMEYLYVDLLCKKLGFIPTDRTVVYQNRDKSKFASLSQSLQGEYQKGGECFIKWVEEKDLIHENSSLIVDRLSDGDGMQGDVSDIRLSIDNQTINISLKHNHAALKHQRPSNLPGQCGFGKSDVVTKQYKLDYNNVDHTFIQAAEKVIPGNNLFNNLKAKDNTYINKNLYLPMCTIVSQFINQHVKGDKVNILFRFIVGNLDFYKVISYSNQLTILEYSELAIPETVVATIVEDSYVKLDFDNGWSIMMRLHTASSRIERSASLKFDSQTHVSPVPETRIPF